MKPYSETHYGNQMMQFDELPPKLRAMCRRDRSLNVGFMLIALDDGLSEEEIVTKTLDGSGWWRD